MIPVGTICNAIPVTPKLSKLKHCAWVPEWYQDWYSLYEYPIFALNSFEHINWWGLPFLLTLVLLGWAQPLLLHSTGTLCMIIYSLHFQNQALTCCVLRVGKIHGMGMAMTWYSTASLAIDQRSSQGESCWCLLLGSLYTLDCHTNSTTTDSAVSLWESCQQFYFEAVTVNLQIIQVLHWFLYHKIISDIPHILDIISFLCSLGHGVRW